MTCFEVNVLQHVLPRSARKTKNGHVSGILVRPVLILAVLEAWSAEMILPHSCFLSPSCHRLGVGRERPDAFGGLRWQVLCGDVMWIGLLCWSSDLSAEHGKRGGSLVPPNLSIGVKREDTEDNRALGHFENWRQGKAATLIEEAGRSRTPVASDCSGNPPNGRVLTAGMGAMGRRCVRKGSFCASHQVCPGKHGINSTLRAYD